MNLLKSMSDNKKLIFKLAKNDFKTKFAGSYLGIFWAFVQPVITILVYWFVFQVGFHSQAVNNEFPFVVWLTAGLVPWFYFSEAWMGASNSLLEYSYLVKKVVFHIDVLPVIKVISALFVNIFFIVFFMILCSAYGYYPSIYAVQILYYVICEILLVMALSYITSAVIVFFRDLGQLLNIVLQVGMWMTPIMWQHDMIGEKNQFILKLNPMYYIVQGYRNSMLSHEWFWNDIAWTAYFWAVMIIIFAIGTKIFKKLKPHFADVL